MTGDYKNLSLSAIAKLLHIESDYKANKELARRVVGNDERSVNYYIAVLSLPILNHIENKIIHRDILSEFYEFLSNPYNHDTKQSEWRRVGLYKGETSRLDTYTSVITTRHFCKVAAKEREIRDSESEWIDYVDYQSLLECTTDEDSVELIPGSKVWKARKAFESLSERDQLVISALVIDKMSALEAYPLIEPYIKPHAKGDKTSEQIKAGWSDKQKQDALSLIKGRAIKMFINKFMEI